MARTQKDVVSYFPHDANACSGDTLTVLQSRFGNNGYAFWFKLLEKLASTDGHSLDVSNQTKWHLLLAKMGVNEITGVDIMNLLVEMKAIDGELWQSKVIWCQNLVDNLVVVYSSRHREPPKRPITTRDNAITTGKNCIICGNTIEDMREDAKYCSNACRQKAYRVTAICNAETPQIPISTDHNAITTGKKGITTVLNTQSKVKESKVNKIILPDFIDKETWDAYLKTRKKPTEHAKTLLIRKLEEFRDAGDDPNEVLKRSIMNGWSGIFPLDKKGGQDGTYRRNPRAIPKPGGYTNPKDL